MMQIENISRTTPIGMFNYAETYRRSAKALNEIEDRWTHPEAPVEYLFSHSIELFIKSYLLKFKSASELKKIGHSIKKNYYLATANGLTELRATTYLVNNFDLSSFLKARYIETGYFQKPTNELLSYVSAELCHEVHKSFLDEFPNLGEMLSLARVLESEKFNVSKIAPN